jgi:hypothetical protein
MFTLSIYEQQKQHHYLLINIIITDYRRIRQQLIYLLGKCVGSPPLGEFDELVLTCSRERSLWRDDVDLPFDPVGTDMHGRNMHQHVFRRSSFFSLI